jgi:heat shock protein HslJ
MKRSFAVRGLLIGLLLFGAAACGDDSEATTSLTPTLQLAGKTFTLAQAAGVEVPANSALQLAFTADRANITAGCNTMNGRYAVENAKLVLSDFSTTEMACVDDALMPFERTIADFLAAEPGIVQAADVLTLADSAITLTFREDAPVVDSALEGITWTVTGTVQGDGTSSLDTAPATLLLQGGTAQVFAGCNVGSSTYTVDGDTITFGTLALTTKACDAAATSLESTVVGVLTGTVQFDVEGTKLTLFQGTDGLTLADRG